MKKIDRFEEHLIKKKGAIEEAIKPLPDGESRSYYKGKLDEVKEVLEKYNEMKNAPEAATSKDKMGGGKFVKKKDI